MPKEPIEIPRAAPRLISIPEAIALGYGSRAAIYCRIKEGTYKDTKIDGRVRLLEDSLIQAVESSLISASDAR